MINLENGTDLIVFSSEAFGSTEVRTTKLITHLALTKRVYFIEAPIIGLSKDPTYFLKKNEHEVTIIQPYLPAQLSVFEQKHVLLELIKELIHDENIIHYTAWTDSPKSMAFIRNLSSEIVVYDCIHNYSNSHPELEQEIFQYADLILTASYSGHGDEGVFSPEDLSKDLDHFIGGHRAGHVTSARV